MKVKLILILVFFVFVAKIFSQKNFVWEKIDSINKTKSQLYTDIKLIISETWKSAKDVIQNDDKDGGVIVVKGLTTTVMKVPMGMGNQNTYYYYYTVAFYMKEKKYKLVIDNVNCYDARYSGMNQQVKTIQPFDGPYTGPGYWENGVKAEKAEAMMVDLKSNLQMIFDSLILDINKKSKSTDW